MSIKHGMAKTRVYEVWKGMKQRCSNPKHISYPYYGGRGIRVTPEWEEFENFYADMGDPPDDYEIDREDNDGDYTKDNCRWVPARTNRLNKSDARMLTRGGKTQNLMLWVDELGLEKSTILRRLDKGMTDEDALQPDRYAQDGT